MKHHLSEDQDTQLEELLGVGSFRKSISISDIEVKKEHAIVGALSIIGLAALVAFLKRKRK